MDSTVGDLSVRGVGMWGASGMLTVVYKTLWYSSSNDLMGFEKKSRHAKISEDSVAFDNVIS
jgi:hypothetical protein